MKSNILLAAILIAAWLPAFSQDCKYEKNEVDKFTNTAVKVTKPELVYSKAAAGGLGGVDMLNLQASKNGDKYALLVRYIYTSKTAVFYNESEAKGTAPDAKLLLLLANGTIITANSQAATNSVSNKANAVAHIDLEFSISQNDLWLLRTNKVTSIRICKGSDASQVLMEGEVKPKYSVAISKVAYCVLE